MPVSGVDLRISQSLVEKCKVFSKTERSQTVVVIRVTKKVLRQGLPITLATFDQYALQFFKEQIAFNKNVGRNEGKPPNLQMLSLLWSSQSSMQCHLK
jgi:hypothetical protein